MLLSLYDSFLGVYLLVDFTCFYSKVVRRASLSDRHNLCRKEYETEAIVWRGGREEEEKEKESDQENNQVLPFITVCRTSIEA